MVPCGGNWLLSVTSVPSGRTITSATSGPGGNPEYWKPITADADAAVVRLPEQASCFVAATPIWVTDSAPVLWTRILLWYPAWLRAAAISGAASATERSRHEVSLPSPGMTALGTPTRWPALSIAAPPELPYATRAVVSSSNRELVTCPIGSGTNVDRTPLVTVIDFDSATLGNPSTVTGWSS